jgi:lysophospholipase L1-like esterase
MKRQTSNASVLFCCATLLLLLGAAAAKPLFPNTDHGRLLWTISRVVQGSTPSTEFNDNFTTGYYEELLAHDRPSGGDQAASVIYNFQAGYRIYDHLPSANTVTKAEGEFRTNSFGMTDREYPREKPAGTLRIAMLGDSFVRGLSAPYGTSFEAVFEDMLNQASGVNGRQVEVLNFGVSGYRLTQTWDVMRERASLYKPDVYMLSITDLTVFRRWEQHLVRLVNRGDDLKYDLLRDVAKKAGLTRNDTNATAHEKLKPYRLFLVKSILASMKRQADSEGARLIALLVPTLEESWLNHRRMIGIDELVRAEGIPTVYLLDTFEKVSDLESLRVHPLDLHPNAKGHRMLAANLFRKLANRPELGIIPKGSVNPQETRNRRPFDLASTRTYSTE